MSIFQFQIKNLEAVKKTLKKYPEISGPMFAQAINAGTSEIIKMAEDGDNTGLFNFKTPRSKRTGQLALSFRFGQKFATADNLVGAVGPTVNYAVWVNNGHSITRGGRTYGRTQPNPYMERILKKATPMINRHFGEALESITKQLAIK